MNRSILIVLLIIAFDSGGVGLMMPVMPALMREFSVVENVALMLGVFIAVFAAMQFIFGPLMGVLSDKFGRKPVLVVSLLIAAIDYLIMALTPWLWLLFAARVVSGIMAASITVCMAYVGDVSSDETRTRNFGFAQAAFGLGFLFGPVTGGLLGTHWVRLPFLGAMGFALIAAILAIIFLPETRREGTQKLEPRMFNPFAPLKHIFTLKGLWPVLVIFFATRIVNQAYGAVLVIFHENRFGWTPAMAGIAISLFGACQMLALTILPGPLSKRFGVRMVVLFGMAIEIVGLTILSVLSVGFFSYFLAPLFATAGIAVPALQSIASESAGADAQGEVQGVLTGLTGLSAIIGPIGFALLYAATQMQWDGTVWFTNVLLYLIALPLLLLLPGRLRAADSKAA